MHTLRNILPAAAGLVVLLSCPCCPGEAPGADEIGTEQSLSVRQRLQRAIDATRELYDTARLPTAEELVKKRPMPLLDGAAYDAFWNTCSREAAEIVPRPKPAAELRCSIRGEVARYVQLRPWTTRYSSFWLFNADRADAPKWPEPADAPQLRELLGADDPAMRAMAVEALATLHVPEDIPRIAGLLDDESEAPPMLGWNRSTSTVPTFSFDKPRADVLEVMRSWHARQVKDYARRALTQLTGGTFTAESFPPWWERNQNARHRLWYWQQRLCQEACETQAVAYFPPLFAVMTDAERAACWAACEKEVETRKEALRRRTAEELRRLPAEVEAKVWLLVRYPWTSTREFTDPEGPLLDEIGHLRLSPERLLDLMDRKGLWEDGDWKHNKHGVDDYSRMVQRLMRAAPEIFGPEHTDRLRAVLAREEDTLSPEGRVAILLAISRLLPPAGPGNLDDPKTRDGTLRAAIREGSGSAACELVRVGLPQNWPFLKQEFFATGHKWSRQHMVSALGDKPLTNAKRTALRELLFDERFTPLWKTDLWCRAYALRSVNAHAGKEIFTEPFPKELDDQSLAKLLQEVASALK